MTVRKADHQARLEKSSCLSIYRAHCAWAKENNLVEPDIAHYYQKHAKAWYESIGTDDTAAKFEYEHLCRKRKARQRDPKQKASVAEACLPLPDKYNEPIIPDITESDPDPRGSFTKDACARQGVATSDYLWALENFYNKRVKKIEAPSKAAWSIMLSHRASIPSGGKELAALVARHMPKKEEDVAEDARAFAATGLSQALRERFSELLSEAGVAERELAVL